MSPLRSKKSAKTIAAKEVAPTNKAKKKTNHAGKTIVIKPRASEKAYAQSQERNTYVFEVDKRANVHSIASAVAAQYEVSVAAVRIAGTSGKVRRTYRRQGRVVHKGLKPGIRKAYVTLEEGNEIPIFAAAESSDPTPEAGGKR